MLRFLIEWIIYQKTMIRRKIEKIFFLMRKIDEVKHEIFQLEKQHSIFTNTRNAKKENSIV
jgi:hypothetical protein